MAKKTHFRDTFMDAEAEKNQADADDNQGIPGDWRLCNSTHCQRSQECRSPHECGGRGRFRQTNRGDAGAQSAG